MKKFFIDLSVSVLCFSCGLTVASFYKPKRVQSVAQNTSSLTAVTTTSSNATSETKDEFPNLIDDQYVTKFNGKKLRLPYGEEPSDVSFAIDSASVASLEDGGMLTSLEDTLYRLSRDRHIVWSYHTAPIFSYTFVAGTNMVYGTVGDNGMFILDAATGKELYSDSRNGSAAYGVARNYRDDMCLITDNFVMYREKFRGDNLEPMRDGITCWRGTKMLWHQDFPPDAELVVSGKRILAVTKSKKAIYVKEIVPPSGKVK